MKNGSGGATNRAGAAARPARQAASRLPHPMRRARQFRAMKSPARYASGIAAAPALVMPLVMPPVLPPVLPLFIRRA
jgi:hypothetical protein